MDYNYHTHTYRCGHASGTPEEYILHAMKNGIRYMGFSDHIPLLFEDGSENIGIRVPVSEAGDYVTELQALREKYRDKIEISIGFESEYYPTCFDSMVADAQRWGAEYLILGQHYTSPELPDGIPHIFTGTDDPATLEVFAASLIAAIQTGVFTYVAHPDGFRFFGDKEIYQSVMRQVCAASKACDIPLEMNFLGIRDSRHYPNEWFWEIVGQEQAPVTFGFDSHRAIDAYDGRSLLIAEGYVKKYSLNYIGRPRLISI